MIRKLNDGITNIFNHLVERRNNLNHNVFSHKRLSYSDMRAISKSGIGSKIVRLKTGYALNDTLQFKNDKDREFYDSTLAQSVKNVAKWQLIYGRGIVVLFYNNDVLNQPLRLGAPDGLNMRVFSGNMVNVAKYNTDLMSKYYMKPTYYSVRGETIHASRVIDFTYVMPDEEELPNYTFGGISEFELIQRELMGDAITYRAGVNIVEKASTLFYFTEGLHDEMKSGNDEHMLKYFSSIEDKRNLYGAGVLDANDRAEVLPQNITDLDKVDTMTLRRVAMVTGIPVPILIGENVQGLNSSGKNERTAFLDTIENYQSDYLLTPINKLAKMFGLGSIEFKENQADTAEERAAYVSTVLDNAIKMQSLGEDYTAYLLECGVINETETDNSIFDLFKDSDFEENEHPRDGDGKFAKGGNSSTIKLTGDELGEYSDIKELRQKATDYYKNNLQGKTVTNPNLGEVLFTGKGQKKFVSTSVNPDKLYMVTILPEIIEQGKYEGASDLYKERSDGAVKFHRISHNVEIKGKKYKTALIINEDIDGNKFYNLTPDEDFEDNIIPQQDCKRSDAVYNTLPISSALSRGNNKVTHNVDNINIILEVAQ